MARAKTNGNNRMKNPPVGLVTTDTDPDAGAWKAEHTSFEVPTVSLHVHERIDPRSIIEAVKKRNGGGAVQGLLFGLLDQNPPLREALVSVAG